MFDFDSYLPRYKEKIQYYYSFQPYGQEYLPICNAFHNNYRDNKLYFAYQIEDSEKELFAGILFSTNLLSQVVYAHGKNFLLNQISDRNLFLQYTEEKRILFPEIIKGLLGDWDFHVCPSVLPLMIFYMDSKTEIINGFGHQDIFKARAEWIKRHDLFQESLKWILRDLFKNIKILCNIDINLREHIEIENLIWSEFTKINNTLICEKK
jgi:hypothetical protein